MTDLVQGVRKFMAGADQSRDRFNPAQACFYTGMQLEEMAEKISEVAKGAISASTSERLFRHAAAIDALAKEFKAGKFQGDIGRADHAELIDADFDMLFTSAAAMLSTSIDTEGAITHGCETNLAKLVEGKIVRDPETSKVLKPEGWKPPDFTPFVDPNAKGE